MVIGLFIIFRVVIIVTKKQGTYEGKLFKLPFFKNMKSKNLRRIVNLLVVNVLCFWLMFVGFPSRWAPEPIPLENLFSENFYIFPIMTLFISVLMFIMFYILNNNKTIKVKINIPYYWEMVLWSLLLVIVLYFGISLSDQLEEMLFQVERQ